MKPPAKEKLWPLSEGHPHHDLSLLPVTLAVRPPTGLAVEIDAPREHRAQHSHPWSQLLPRPTCSLISHVCHQFRPRTASPVFLLQPEYRMIAPGHQIPSCPSHYPPDNLPPAPTSPPKSHPHLSQLSPGFAIECFTAMLLLQRHCHLPIPTGATTVNQGRFLDTSH